MVVSSFGAQGTLSHRELNEVVPIPEKNGDRGTVSNRDLNEVVPIPEKNEIGSTRCQGILSAESRRQSHCAVRLVKTVQE